MIKRIALFILLLIFYLNGCITVSSDYVSAKLPASVEIRDISLVKSVYEPPGDLPSTLSVSRADVILEEALIMDGNCRIGNLSDNDATYEQIKASKPLQKNIINESPIKYIAVLKMLSYEKPTARLFIGFAAASEQAYQLKMQLRILDLVTGIEYVAETVSESTQQSSTVVLKHDRRRTVGEESAVGVALEEGVYKLVHLLFGFVS